MATVEEFILDNFPGSKTSTSSACFEHVQSTQAERALLGAEALESCAEWKRILAPMLSYELVQEALVVLLREAQEVKGRAFADMLTPERKKVFNELLTDLKKLKEQERNKLHQRHEEWINTFREQVDYAPGVDGEKSAKRIVDVHELADLLTLATSTKASGNESFAEHDFTMAITRYVQVNNFLKDICAARDEENSMIDDVVFKANRNLTLAALKNWEWGRAKRACDTVLEHNPDDRVVLTRRAEAYRQLGRFEHAYSDLTLVLKGVELTDKTNVAATRKARKMKAEMDVEDKSSAEKLRGPLSEGLSNSNIFSDDRPEPGSFSCSDDDDSSPLRDEYLNRLRNMRQQDKGKSPEKDVRLELSAPSLSASVPKKTRFTNLLDLKLVEEIQEKQMSLFSSPSAKASLEKMQLEVGLEQDRFFHRLRPFKLQTQLGLLEEYGFPPTQAGLITMERAIAAHMVDHPEVRKRGKKLLQYIMGDIWSA